MIKFADYKQKTLKKLKNTIAKRILKDYWKSYSDLGGTFLENLQGLTTLKVFNIDEKRHEKMNEEAEKFRKITMKVLSM